MDEGTNKHQATTTKKDNRSHSSWRLLYNFSNATFAIFFLVRIITQKKLYPTKKQQTLCTYLLYIYNVYSSKF
jgi:hypothetical protein